MPLTIKPQDKRPPEKIELELHPDLISRLKSFAESLNGSDVSYVVGQILDQALPAEKATKKPQPAAAEDKPKKEGPRKVA